MVLKSLLQTAHSATFETVKGFVRDKNLSPQDLEKILCQLPKYTNPGTPAHLVKQVLLGIQAEMITSNSQPEMRHPSPPNYSASRPVTVFGPPAQLKIEEAWLGSIKSSVDIANWTLAQMTQDAKYRNLTEVSALLDTQLKTKMTNSRQEEKTILGKMATHIEAQPECVEKCILQIAIHLRNWTDPVAQQTLATAIRYQNFGQDPEVLNVLVTHLPTFTEPGAQQTLATAIRCQNFGNDPEVLQALVTHLPTFTDPTAQQTIAIAIFNQKFGQDPEVLNALVTHLPTFTDPTAQQTLATAIRCQNFGNDPEVLNALVTHLPTFTDPTAQQT
ncbi:hypothetical protein EBR57_07125, partial [bacterium]|nr:hypothetical protein [bacterium]